MYFSLITSRWSNPKLKPDNTMIRIHWFPSSIPSDDPCPYLTNFMNSYEQLVEYIMQVLFLRNAIDSIQFPFHLKF